MILTLLAQQIQGPTGVEGILATYGPFAPFAALTLFLLRLLWADNKTKEENITKLTERIMDKIIPLTLEATSILSEAAQGLKDNNESIIQMNRVVEDLRGAVNELESTIKLERK